MTDTIDGGVHHVSGISHKTLCGSYRDVSSEIFTVKKACALPTDAKAGIIDLCLERVNEMADQNIENNEEYDSPKELAEEDACCDGKNIIHDNPFD